MGKEPTAAARWIAYWPRLSFTRADAGGVESRSFFAMSRLDFEAVRWRAVWFWKSGGLF